ncbi:hypothetical protein NQ317_005553 [Molorchus minor]|uniref:Inositol-3-phosphate synthase n=1 Tax=Molorchus minor TaxID=1323400 RepID=A0ABQ9JW43_9CUCU|nr:hypothetical protein NQ317_005553 [Molorchus minor]
MEIVVNSPNVKYLENVIEAKYEYQYTRAIREENKIVVIPKSENLVIRTSRKVPRLGVMLVGWGGNNGSTFTAAVIANRLGLSWPTRRGIQKANWFGSLTQAATVPLGDDVFVPFSQLLPTVHPDDIVIDGWDISNYNLYESMERAQVLEPALIQQLKPHMIGMKPRPSVYYPHFIAANQKSRADNVIEGTKLEQVERLMRDISQFKNLPMWTKSLFCGQPTPSASVISSKALMIPPKI